MYFSLKKYCIAEFVSGVSYIFSGNSLHIKKHLIRGIRANICEY